VSREPPSGLWLLADRRRRKRSCFQKHFEAKQSGIVRPICRRASTSTWPACRCSIPYGTMCSCRSVCVRLSMHSSLASFTGSLAECFLLVCHAADGRARVSHLRLKLSCLGSVLSLFSMTYALCLQRPRAYRASQLGETRTQAGPGVAPGQAAPLL